MRGKRKKIFFICLGIIIAIFVICAYVWWILLRPSLNFPEDARLTVTVEENGILSASWTEAELSSGYKVKVSSPSEDQEERNQNFSVLKTDKNTCIIKDFPAGADVEIQIMPCLYGKIPVIGAFLEGKDSLAVSIPSEFFTSVEPEYVVDEKTGELTVSFQPEENIMYRLFRETESGEQVTAQAEGGTVRVVFGESGDCPYPAYDETDTFFLRPVLDSGNCEVRGMSSGQIVLTRADFLAKELELTVQNQGGNEYLLTWNEVACDHYEVQRMTADQEWETLASVAGNEARKFETGRLSSCTSYTFRVTASGSENEFSARTTFRTEPSVLYATIWPMKDLPLLDEADLGDTSISAEAGRAYCVLGEQDGRFLVRVDENQGYIDSNYCLINLPEYLGELCSYDIVNSYSALFAMHGYTIPGLTGTVINGYEDVRFSDGEMVVPYLYPCCKKLLTAAESLEKEGYRLKIYDAFRPNEATRSMYDTASAILDQQLPGGNGTYRNLVSSGQYSLSYFLARGISSHNRGIALDLTLENMDGEELQMQTGMHDLSIYSVTDANNSNARLLARYMTDAGFDTLVSEWWHFQDNETYKALDMGYLKEGLSIEGWKYEGQEWRYRNGDGSWEEK